MSDDYWDLARVFHADRSGDARARHEGEARRRVEADSSFRTGVVTALGELFTATPRVLSLKLGDLARAERRIAVLWEVLPQTAREEYLAQAVSQELLVTNAMEGVKSTRKETDRAVESVRNGALPGGGTAGSAKPVRFGEFARLYLALTDGTAALPQSLEDIRRIYDAVAGGEVAEADRPDGELFRAHAVSVEGPRGPEHQGMSGELRIGQALTQMMAMVANPGIPGLQSAIMAHFVFEYVHPFYDGNGRTGRYLLALYLKDELTLPTILSLSRVIAECKNKYYKAFRQAEGKLNCGELTSFVLTLLDFIGQAQAELIDRFEAQAGQMDRAVGLGRQLGEEHGLARQAVSLLEFLMEDYVAGGRRGLTLDDASARLGLGKQSARAYLGQLADSGLAEYAARRPLRVSLSADLAERLDE
ncbi:Fic family protein [Bifidobacterium xylocopae]|uniref:Cell filamentation protein Fic n=1 Tax=Bifidobacterium xylocopae TaxID=2493119 RepID=A0A366KGR8_9BIFI|nr:Fic family protein [Bifidobacterium xylocopae]RBP99881.1 cell filamentation protein Fic [Bifidobacterium xylocopae]